MRHILVAVLFFTSFVMNAQTPVVKVDLNMSGRTELECNDPNYTAWIPDNATSISKTVNGVTFTFKMAGSNGTALKATWYKVGVQSPNYARLVCDGLYVDGGAAGAQIQLTITGLSTGTHSLMAFHNALDDPASYTFAPLDISVNGTTKVTGLAMSKRALTSTATQSSYLTFNATAGQSVVILYKAQTSGSQTMKNVYINGFELNTPNVKEQAKDPYPADGDFHANADAGSLIMSWTKGTSATKHIVYLGTDLATVTSATTSSTVYKGTQTTTTYTATGLYNLNTYYWRVDEVDANGVVTKGNVWMYRPRHIAFPGAEGYGRFAIGGRGGKVVHVTNLKDDGSAGSLRYAIETETGPRTIVFDVSGVIVVTSRLVCSDSYVTIAGQTAPSPGICLREAPLGLCGNDMITRFMRIQIGYGDPTTYDGMGLTGSNHSILDHSSINFAIDEQFSSRSGKNITVQNMLIAEALNAADHQNYPSGTEHGYAGSIGGDIGSFHHNLLAHNYGRNWSLAGGLDGNAYYSGRLQIVNQVVYNFGGRVTDGGCMELDFINNYYKQGAGSSINTYSLNIQHENTGLGMQRAYFAGNIFQLKDGSYYCDGTNNSCGRIESFSNGDYSKYTCFVSSQFSPTYVTTQSATNAFKVVLSDVGVTQPAQSARDIRLINETKNGTYSVTGSVTGKKGFPDREGDTGGFDAFASNTRGSSWDTDKDGLPDFWEIFYGSNKSSSSGDFSDANADADKDGYTELEEYMSWMAAPHYFLAYGGSQSIDLAAMFRGFGSSVAYSSSGATNGTVSISGTTAKFTASSCGFASFTLTATESGFSMSKTVGVFVESSPAGTCVSSTAKAPVVSITAPVTNTSKMVTATFALTATATDADGTIAKVEFYNGTTLLGTGTASGSTYTFNWTTSIVGAYSITAKATDNSGLTTVSSAITLSVVAGPATYVFVYDNLGNQAWTYTGNWTPAAIPTDIDTAVIRTGEVKISQDFGGVVKVEQGGTFRSMGYYTYANIQLLGGTIKVNTSNQTYGMNAAINVEEESTVMSGANPLTIFTLAGTITGSANLVKTGLGLVKLTATATSYKGMWYVAQDTLTVASASGLGQCGAIVDTAVLDIDVAVSTNSLTIMKGGKLNLDANLSVQAAVFDSLNIPAGTYTASNYPGFITGSGTLAVAKSVMVVGAPAAGVITLSSTAGSTFSWTDTTSAVVSSSATFAPAASGIYTVKASTSAGCAVTSAPVYTQLITLKKGWNLISMNLRPTDSSIATLFNGINANEIKTMDAFWRTGQLEAFNSLTTITPGYGYLVNMNSVGRFMVAGTPDLEGFQNLQGLQAGWQLIGCSFQSATPFANYFNSTNCSVVKNFNGFWVPDGTANSIQDLGPGEGYFIKR